MTMTITESNQNFMVASVFGTAVQNEDPSDPSRITSSVLISGEFRAVFGFPNLCF
jgi:hypothetical protein